MAAAPARVYLDHASATPWHPAALAAARQVAESLPGDPARRHREGRAAGLLQQIAGGAPLAVAANRSRPARILSSAVEHSAVLAAADAAAEASGGQHVRVPVDAVGRVDLDALQAELRGGALLVNLLHAGHEVGTLQPLAEAAALCAEHDALLHVDACQTAGRLPVSLEGIGADFMSVSAAKFGGGRGTGALLWSPRARLRPLLRGDERERRVRAGLEHLPGVAAMAEAVLQLRPSDPHGPAAGEAARQDALRRRLRAGVPEAVDDVVVHGPDDATAPHIVALSALYCDGETMVSELDARGFAVHSGSSCATTSGEPSHVLVAMGALTHGHVRVSLGPGVEAAHTDAFTGALADVVRTLRG
ncbi:MAG TPA: aminotransferase class V-fold PLP-dependent enzyme [Egibacteraceae bacterium]|nr:aminotransferase class V-fold PLP-dependent enzyme [Egibacteraceae bacterium]